MSRVFRALEKAEREKQERLKEEPLTKIFKEMSVSRKQEEAIRPPAERVKPVKLPRQDETLISGDEGPLWIASENSFAAEEFRKLKTQIFHWSPLPPQIILVTSAFPGEGKTTVAVNLAMTISKEIQKKAILIDGDLRRPHTFLQELKTSKGLSDYLSDQTPLSQIMVNLESESFWGIPAGSPTEKPSELIGSQKMRDLLASLRKFKDEDPYIIIDSPPLVAAAEPMSISKMVDGIIVVVMAERTTKETLKRAIQTIDRQKIIGVVFNQKESKSLSSYYSSDRYYKMGYYKSQGKK
jgi:capsular exopolysaccharide synthesis family protein